MHDVSVPFPLLSMLIVVPLVGAILTMLIPKTRTEIVKVFGLVFSGATLALCLWLMTNFKAGEAGYQFASKHEWISQFGISWNLGVDGISLWLVVLTGVLFPIAIFGPDERHDVKPYIAWLLLLEAGVMGVFMSLDLFLFFVFFEVVLVPLYFLIGGWGHGAKTYAAQEEVEAHEDAHHARFEEEQPSDVGLHVVAFVRPEDGDREEHAGEHDEP